jgi:hypothetical protein
MLCRVLYIFVIALRDWRKDGGSGVDGSTGTGKLPEGASWDNSHFIVPHRTLKGI